MIFNESNSLPHADLHKATSVLGMLRNIRIEGHVSMQLHFEYRKHTVPAPQTRSGLTSNHSKSLHTLLLHCTTSWCQGWSRGLCFWLRASIRYGSLCSSGSWYGLLRLWLAGFADRLGCWFRLCTATDSSGLRATADRNIEVDPRSVKGSLVAPVKSGGQHIPREERDQRRLVQNR